ncbi:Retrovirus-related Pol polyprotein from transposon 412 family [Cucumis melo var. makuwa]|uniref:Retrovirus-related Pol polyprotein from transposon 412 family n=1 Tax=Cucumis melo var. makuwa TaxID=1194695 RepID=A0A5A7UKH8_CUCMM|nr:Retrovirus-related Pol polyprotein from transposon 412 family [Cucumis melo var. makuwa]
MVREEIVLGSKISNTRLKVDLTKIDVVCKFLPPSDVKPLRSFLGQPYNFDKKRNQAFQTLKDALALAPIFIMPDWSQPFELMCDASDVAVGAMFGQKKNKVIHPIYYTSKTLKPHLLHAQVQIEQFFIDVLFSPHPFVYGLRKIFFP